MFADRREAGTLLAEELSGLENTPETLVVGIARGGVFVATALAEVLSLPMTAIVVKKIQSPHDQELAIGAVTHNGVKVIDWMMTLKMDIEQEYFDREIITADEVVRSREQRYQNLPLIVHPKFSTFIITDDGIATGSTVKTAVKFFEETCGQRGLTPTIIIAAPVIPKNVYKSLIHSVDAVIALEIPEEFTSVSQFYKSFEQVGDDEVLSLLTSR